MITAITQADKECGNCGCEFDILYKKALAILCALEEFEGTILMTTHDVNADVSWATTIVNLEDLFKYSEMSQQKVKKWDILVENGNLK